MGKRRRVAGISGALSMLLTLVVAAEAQAPKVYLKDSPSAQLTLTPFTPSAFPVFKVVFHDRTLPLEPASFIISNGTDKAIIGIGVTWTVTGTSGEESTYSNRTHIFLGPNFNPLAVPHGRLLAGPQTFISEAILTQHEYGVIATAPGDRTIAQFSGASVIHAEVDCVIFQHGEVVGPDRLGLVDMIRERTGAVRGILTEVERAQANGKDPTELLRQIVATPIRGGDQAGKLKFDLADRLLRARRLEPEIQYLKGIPTPPLFFRKDGGPIWRQ